MLTGIILVVAIVALIGCALLKSELTDAKALCNYANKSWNECLDSLTAARNVRYEEAKLNTARLEEANAVVTHLRKHVDELRGYMDKLTPEAQGKLAAYGGAELQAIVPTNELLRLRDFAVEHFGRLSAAPANKAARPRKTATRKTATKRKARAS